MFGSFLSGQRVGVRIVCVHFARVHGGRTIVTSVRGVRTCNTDVKSSEPLVDCPCENSCGAQLGALSPLASCSEFGSQDLATSNTCLAMA